MSGACSTSAGGQLFYSVSVPTGSRATIVTTPAGATPVSQVARVLSDCAATTCASSTSGSTAQTQTYDNTSGSTQTIIVSVSSSSAGAGGTFDLLATVAVIPPAPPNDTCAGAIALTFTGNTATATGDTTAANNNNLAADASPSCSSSAKSSGKDLVDSYTLAAPKTVVITVTPTSPPTTTTFEPVVYVRSLCADITAPNEKGCVANFSSTPHVLTLSNQPAGTYFLWVDGSTSSSGPFSLNVTTSTPVVGGETCAAPLVISANTTIVSTTTGMANDFAFVDTGLCQGGSSVTATAPDAVFRTTIPANSVLTVATVATWDRILNVVATPASVCGGALGAGIACLAGSDTSPETVNVTNATLNPQDVFIILDGYSAGEGSYQLTTSTAAIPTPYTKTTITPACQSMTTGVALVGPVGDDVASAIVALPFTFSFYTQPMTHFSMTSNGYAQLWPSSVGAPSSTAANVTIPDTGTPNALLAPFWDDLNSATGATAKTLVTGTAPNRRFTMEWAGFTFYGGTGTERLTFQVQLVETTNLIEFHYCTLTASTGDATRTLGNQATVGIESANGTAGTLHSFNAANGAVTTTALRFTP